MPFSIQLRPSELRVHGELESTELDNKEMLMLLSLQAPAQTREGQATRHSVHERLPGTVPSLKPPQGHGTDPNVHIGLLKEAGTEMIVKYEDKLRELICSVGGKYLAYGQAEELLASLVNALKAGKRTELNWNVWLEDANRSLDEAIRMMEEAPTDTTRNDAGTSSTDHPRDRTRSRDHAGGASRAPSKGSSKGRSQNTAVESDPASLDHQEVRHDLLALGEDPNHPHVLSQEYLNLIVSGHKSRGSKSFKAWLQKDGGGPPVRVSYRTHPGNSWEKYPNNMRYYTKYTCVRWSEGGRWSCTERGKDLQFYECYQTKPQALLIFLVAPHRGSAYYVGGLLPDLQKANILTMTSGQAKAEHSVCLPSPPSTTTFTSMWWEVASSSPDLWKRLELLCPDDTLA